MEKFTRPENNIFKFENWSKAPIQKEGGEFERVITAFYDSDLINDKELLNHIKDKYEDAEPINLDFETWQNLQNTDSTAFEKDQWEELSEKIESHGRNWQVIRDAYKENKSMELPIIARLPSGVIHLISGNTRLCVAKVVGFSPKVIILGFPEKYFK